MVQIFPEAAVCQHDLCESHSAFCELGEKRQKRKEESSFAAFTLSEEKGNERSTFLFSLSPFLFELRA